MLAHSPGYLQHPRGFNHNSWAGACHTSDGRGACAAQNSAQPLSFSSKFRQHLVQCFLSSLSLSTPNSISYTVRGACRVEYIRGDQGSQVQGDQSPNKRIPKLGRYVGKGLPGGQEATGCKQDRAGQVYDGPQDGDGTLY